MLHHVGLWYSASFALCLTATEVLLRFGPLYRSKRERELACWISVSSFEIGTEELGSRLRHWWLGRRRERGLVNTEGQRN